MFLAGGKIASLFIVYVREEQKSANKPDAKCVIGKAAVHLCKETKRPAIRSKKAPTEKVMLLGSKDRDAQRVAKQVEFQELPQRNETPFVI